MAAHPGAAAGPRVAHANAMSFASYVDRVRNDFIEMGAMELTLPQAVRLWNLGADDCRYVLDALVDAGFLAWTPRRTVMRTGRELHIEEVGRDAHRRGIASEAHVSVRRAQPVNKSVGQ
jgi:hypothetical protein